MKQQENNKGNGLGLASSADIRYLTASINRQTYTLIALTAIAGLAFLLACYVAYLSITRRPRRHRISGQVE